MMRAVGALGEAEAVSADYHPILQDHAVSDPAELSHGRVRMGQEIVADACAFVNDRVRMQHRIAPDAHALADHRERPDGGALAENRCFGDERQRMNAGRRPGRLVEEFQGAREIEVRIARQQPRKPGRAAHIALRLR